MPRSLEIVKAIAEIAAIVIGGAWIYFNTFRGRTYRPRLQVKLTATRQSADDACLLRARIEVENKGLSEVTFIREGTALQLSYAPIVVKFVAPTSVRFRERTAFTILERHESIEPGVVISEETVLALPRTVASICQLRLVVVARNQLQLTRRNISWSCTAVIAEADEAQGGAA